MRRAGVLLALVTLGLGFVSGPAAAQITAEWTVLVYLNSNTQPGGGAYDAAATADMNELEAVGSTQDLHVVAQWDRAAGAQRYYVVKDTDPANVTSPVLMNLGRTDSGQEQTLVTFFNWATARFPARHYLLVLNGQGKAWLPRSASTSASWWSWLNRPRGFLFDASTTGSAADTNTAVYLTVEELRSALAAIKTANGGRNLDGLILDSGGGATVEVATRLGDSVNAFATQFLNRARGAVVNGGVQYDNLLTTLTTALPATATEMETWLVSVAQTYLAAYGTGTTELGGAQSVTMSVFRPSGLAGVTAAADALAGALGADLKTTAPGLLRLLPAVQRGRGGDYTADFVDLVHFAELCQTEFPTLQTVQTAATQVIDAVAAAVVNSPCAVTQTGDLSVDNFRGLGIYFPDTLAAFDTTYLTANEFGKTTRWASLVRGLLTLYSDKNPPVITIIAPQSGSTLLDNPPQIQATITDPDTGGAVDTTSITLTLDGTVVPLTSLSYDPLTGLLIYTPANLLSAASHTFTLTAKDLSGNQAPNATGYFRITVQTLPTGIQTFSLPRVLTAAQNDPALVFGYGNFALARWVPTLQTTDKYRLWPDTSAGFLPPDALSGVLQPTVLQPPAGLGYWVRVTQNRPLPALPGTAVTLERYPIRLLSAAAGGSAWHMIGAPYDVPAVSLVSCEVQTDDGRVLTFADAVTQRVTPGVLFTYAPNAGNPNAPGTYSFSDPGVGQLLRLQGHWLRADKTFALIVSGSRAVRPVPATRVVAPAGWRLTLEALLDTPATDWAGGRGYRTSDRLVLGAGSGSTDGCDPGWDVAAPPPLAGGLALRSVHGDWGADNGRYARDLRGAGPVQRWDLEVSAPAGLVTLAWPSLRAVPGDLDLTLVDATNGQRRNLRHSAGYTFTHAGGTRTLNLSAARRADVGLLLSDVTVNATRAGAALSVACTLTRPATLRLTVHGLGGTPLRRVGPVAAPVGRSELGWDGRDEQGRALPAGVYRLDLTATTDTGEVVRAARTVRLDR